jgi:hypothetical protein
MASKDNDVLKKASPEELESKRNLSLQFVSINWNLWLNGLLLDPALHCLNGI